MTLITTIPLAFSVAGLLLYIASNNAKVAEAGRIMFACGLLVALYVLATHIVRL